MLAQLSANTAKEPTLGIADARSGSGNSFLEDLLWGYRPHAHLQKIVRKDES